MAVICQQGDRQGPEPKSMGGLSEGTELSETWKGPGALRPSAEIEDAAAT